MTHAPLDTANMEALENRAKAVLDAVQHLSAGLATAERDLRQTLGGEAPPGATRESTDSLSASGGRIALGWLPAIALSSALGVLLCVGAYAFSRSTVSTSQALFWLGLLVIYAPIVTRLSL